MHIEWKSNGFLVPPSALMIDITMTQIAHYNELIHSIQNQSANWVYYSFNGQISCIFMSLNTIEWVLIETQSAPWIAVIRWIFTFIHAPHKSPDNGGASIDIEIPSDRGGELWINMNIKWYWKILFISSHGRDVPDAGQNNEFNLTRQTLQSSLPSHLSLIFAQQKKTHRGNPP